MLAGRVLLNTEYIAHKITSFVHKTNHDRTFIGLYDEKNMPKIFLWFALIWLPCAGYAQTGQSYELTGTVKDPDAKPVEQVSIRLHPLSDSTALLRAFTDGAGEFRFTTLDSVVYVLSIDTKLYQPEHRLVRPRPVGSSGDTIVLQPRLLSEIIVREKRESFQLDADKIIINVAGSALLSGGNALNILEKTPRILVDPFSNAISVDGKPGLQVYLNNRQVFLPTNQVGKYLQGLPANSIERIELLTNPSGRYDATQGSVLNITTRKLDSDGVSLDVSVSPGVGRFGKFNSSIDLSIRRSTWSAYVMYTPQTRSTYFRYDVTQHLSEGSLIGSIAGDQYRRIDTRQHGLRMGADWKLTKQLFVGTNVYGFQSAEHLTTRSNNEYNRVGQDSQIEALGNFDNRLKNVVGNLNARYVLVKSNFSVDADLGQYTDNSVTQSSYSERGDADQSSLSSYFPNDIRIRSLKADFDTKLSAVTTLEAGIKINGSDINSTPRLNQFSPVFDTLATKLTQAFTYQERVRAGYVSISGAFSKLNQITYQASLRYEHTELAVTTLDSRTSQVYNSFFPALTLQKKLSGGGKLMLTYNRRINRPNFSAFNPAYVFLDPFTIQSGNPYLVPQFSTNLQLSYQFPSKHMVMLSLLNNTNRITEVVFRQDVLSPVLYNTQINFNDEQRLSFTYSFPVAITKSWKMQTTLVGYRTQFSTPVNGIAFEISAIAASLNNLHTIKLGANWTADLQIITRTGTALGFMRYKPLFLVNAGLGRPLWNNRGSIKLSGADIFHTVTLINYGTYGITDVRFRHRFESQTAFLTLTYRLGNEKLKRVNQRATASESEQERGKK